METVRAVSCGLLGHGGLFVLIHYCSESHHYSLYAQLRRLTPSAGRPGGRIDGGGAGPNTRECV